MVENNEKHWTHHKLRPFASMTPEEYVDERLNQFREWYDKKATSAKRNYQWMRAITVIGGSIVPVLVNLPLPTDATRYITTLVGLIVVVLISLESVFHFREQWKNYRSTEQLLAKEYFNFVSAEGPYRDMKASDAFLTFVDRVENAISSENASTLNVMTTLSEQKAEQQRKGHDG